MNPHPANVKKHREKPPKRQTSTGKKSKNIQQFMYVYVLLGLLILHVCFPCRASSSPQPPPKLGAGFPRASFWPSLEKERQEAQKPTRNTCNNNENTQSKH